MIPGRAGLIVLAGAVALSLLLGRALSAVVVDHAWYASLDAPAVWREKLIALVLLKGGGWLVGTAFAFANLWAVRATIKEIKLPARVGNLELEEAVPAQRLRAVVLLVSALLGVVLTIPLDDWSVFSMALRGVDFIEYEGYFQRDLGFYAYWLPFEGMLYTWALITVVVITAFITLLYAITRDLQLVDRQLRASTHVRRHLTVLGSVVLLILAWSYRLDAYELLLWGSGFDGLFSRVDHVFTTRIDLALAIGTLAAALVVLRAGWVGQLRAAFVTVTLVLVAALALRQAGPALVARATADGAVDTRDRPYEATRALYTRRAYNVDAMRFVSPPGAVDSLAADLDARAAEALNDERAVARTLASVTLWDAEPLLRSDALTNGELTVVTPPSWQSGPSGPEAAVVTRSTAVTPVWDVRVIAGAEADDRGAPRLTRHRALGGSALPEPLVAPGLFSHRVVRGIALESIQDLAVGAAPRGDADAFLGPAFPATIVETPASRIAHAWATRDVSLLRESVAGERIAVMLYRDVRERVRRLFPTLEQGQSIAPVVHDGGLLWAVDLYSASEHYPLSVRFQLAGAPRSYFKLAGLALVDAQSGRVHVVPVDNPDPIARTWFAFTQELLLPASALPNALRAQLPIPTDGAMAQQRAFTRVGSARTGNRSRYVPDSTQGTRPFAVSGAPGLDDVIGWTVPVVDEADQLIGVLDASGGRSRRTRWYASAEPLPRWSALTSELSAALDSAVARLRADDDGPVTLGSLRVRVVGGQPLLVRPAYATEGNHLRLLAVAAVDARGARSGSRLADVLAAGVGEGAQMPLFGSETDADQRARAHRLYEVMREALRDGNWLRFGSAFDSLGSTLNRGPTRTPNRAPNPAPQ